MLKCFVFRINNHVHFGLLMIRKSFKIYIKQITLFNMLPQPADKTSVDFTGFIKTCNFMAAFCVCWRFFLLLICIKEYAKIIQSFQVSYLSDHKINCHSLFVEHSVSPHRIPRQPLTNENYSFFIAWLYMYKTCYEKKKSI